MTRPLARVEWKPCYRIIPSRFPPVDLFNEIVENDDLEAIFHLEAHTNARLRSSCLTENSSRNASNIIMASFTHLNPAGSRFSDGSYGVLYASDSLEVAISETMFHREKFMSATNLPAMELDMRVYVLDLKAHLYDLRGQKKLLTDIYHELNYKSSQQLAQTIKEEQIAGIVYDSVRHESGHCVAIFDPFALDNCRQERHLCFVWDGKKISDVYEKRSLKKKQLVNCLETL